jgi:isochorismate pyruvate lyase
MADVRAGVDAIDGALVELIAQRQAYMDAAARIKPERAAVRDEARIARVLANVRAQAEEAGLSWDIAEAVWRALIESCIRYEFEEFDKLRTPR